MNKNDMKLPFLSIVTVCLNSEKTIRKTIESVLNQSYRRFEYILIDGGSQDSTVDILKEYEIIFINKKIRFTWKSEKDQGIYDGMNKGIELTNGVIIGIINGDDYYETDAFEKIHKAYLNHPDGDIFYGFMKVLMGKEELAVYRYNYDFFLLNLQSGVFTSAQHSSCFVKRSVYGEIGKFDLSFRISADYDFLVRAACKRKKFIALDHVLANFSRGGANDQMSEYERFNQRYRIWRKNGLVDETEYAKLVRQTRYTRLKQIKSGIVRKLFGFH